VEFIPVGGQQKLVARMRAVGEGDQAHARSLWRDRSAVNDA
jgi:hypothetical protein